MSNALNQGKDSSGKPRDIPVDDITGALLGIDIVHFRTHRGDTFNYSAQLSVGTGANAYLLGRTGANPIHFNDFSVSSDDGPVEIRLFEAPTTTADGALQATYNRNRVSSETATLSIYSAPTVTVDGTELFLAAVMATSTGALVVTGDMVQPEEWILNSSTDYLIKITNTGAGTANIYTSFLWYEGNLIEA